MTKIFEYSGAEVERTTTVGHVIASRHNNAHSAQVTAESASMDTDELVRLIKRLD